MHTYKFELSMDLGKAIPEVGAVMDSVNSNMPSFGFDGQYSLLSSIGDITVQSPRPFTNDEEQRLVKEFNDMLSERLPNLGIRCTNVRRQPGNVPQSAS
jgi:hypothetical protein